jgi:hypothetical protein
MIRAWLHDILAFVFMIIAVGTWWLLFVVLFV